MIVETTNIPEDVRLGEEKQPIFRRDEEKTANLSYICSCKRNYVEAYEVCLLNTCCIQKVCVCLWNAPSLQKESYADYFATRKWKKGLYLSLITNTYFKFSEIVIIVIMCGYILRGFLD